MSPDNNSYGHYHEKRIMNFSPQEDVCASALDTGRSEREIGEATDLKVNVRLKNQTGWLN